MFHRITGAGAACGIFIITAVFYAVAIAYVIFPAPSAMIIPFIHSFPAYIVMSGKFILAAPFFFHSLNGVRHLIWDTGRMLDLPGVYHSGYVVLALTALLSSIFVFFY